MVRMLSSPSRGNSSVTLGHLLKTTRVRLGKTLREVEGETGISNGYLSQLESGLVKQPSPNHLHKLAEVYALEYARLMELAGYAIARQIAATNGKPMSPALESIADLPEEDRRKIEAYIKDLRDARRVRDGVS
jgi:HTH-type transcriptional regulator, competence development regulator